MFGVMFNSLVIGCKRFFISLKAVQRISFCSIRICIGWVEPDRPIVCFQCLIIFAQFAQDFPPVIVSRCIIWCKVNKPIIERQCLIVMFAFDKQFSFLSICLLLFWCIP